MKMEARRLLFGLVLLWTTAALVLVRGEPVCSLNVENDHVTYDLSDLAAVDAAIVTGGDPQGGAQPLTTFNYTLAFCRNLKQSEVPSACPAETKPLEYAALQSSRVDPKQCTALGTASQTTIELIDTRQKANGVVLRYKGGAACASPNALQRNFHIEVRCADVHSVKPKLDLDLDANGKASPCHHRIRLESIHGCPVQCTVGPDAQNKPALCSGRGLCGYDRSGKKARCFCDEGYTGHNCGEKQGAAMAASSGSSAGTTALLALLLLAAIGLFATVVYLASQIKAYRSDAQNYMQIRGTELVEQVGLLS